MSSVPPEPTQTEFYRLLDHRYGAVEVWEPPNPQRAYVIGIDAAGGGSSGDYACGVVVEAETCAQVAIIREKCAPIPFGRRCARLGWYYNEALLAFETYPSGHGLIAAHSCLQYGYPKLYRRHKEGSPSREMGEELGWHTSTRTRDMMIGRIQEAIQGRYEVPCATLIDELMEQRYDEKGKIVCAGHDDLMDAWAIALLVRDEAWRSGQITVPAPKPSNETERFWDLYEKRKALGKPRARIWK